MKRRHWGKQARMLLSERQNHRCCYCGVRTDHLGPLAQRPTIEHIIPLALGGPDRMENLVMACLTCNMAENHRLQRQHAMPHPSLARLKPAQFERLVGWQKLRPWQHLP